MGKAITYHFFNCTGCPSFGTNEYGVLLCWFKTNEAPRVFSPEDSNMTYAKDEWTPAPHWFPDWCPINDNNSNIFQEF